MKRYHPAASKLPAPSRPPKPRLTQKRVRAGGVVVGEPVVGTEVTAGVCPAEEVRVITAAMAVPARVPSGVIVDVPSGVPLEVPLASGVLPLAGG
jgi:hypothetical protein